MFHLTVDVDKLYNDLQTLFSTRLVVLDGAMGT